MGQQNAEESDKNITSVESSADVGRSVGETRQRARVTIAEAANWAECSPTTWRVYEANPDAVTTSVRSRCDAALAKITRLAKAREAA